MLKLWSTAPGNLPLQLLLMMMMMMTTMILIATQENLPSAVTGLHNRMTDNDCYVAADLRAITT